MSSIKSHSINKYREEKNRIVTEIYECGGIIRKRSYSMGEKGGKRPAEKEYFDDFFLGVSLYQIDFENEEVWVQSEEVFEWICNSKTNVEEFWRIFGKKKSGWSPIMERVKKVLSVEELSDAFSSVDINEDLD